MKYKRKPINRIQKKVGMNLEAPFFSTERKINIRKCLVCEQEFKKKERSIHITQSGRLTCAWVSQFRMFPVCDI